MLVLFSVEEDEELTLVDVVSLDGEMNLAYSCGITSGAVARQQLLAP